MGNKFAGLTQVLAEAHWNMNFELTDKVNAFLAKYKLEDQILKPNDAYATLKPEVVQKLMKSQQTFLDNPYKEERIKEVVAGVEQDCKEEFAKQFPALVEHFSVDAGEIEKGDVLYVVADLSYDDGEHSDSHRFEPSNLYVSFEPGIQALEQASSGSRAVNWAAWLGDPDSPFYDESFAEAYDMDSASQALDEFYHTRNESLYADELAAAVEELMSEFNRSYKYIVDLDERGYFRAHVEDPFGKIVYNISNEDPETGLEKGGELSLVEDGFMKHSEDVRGLEQYLKQHGIMPNEAHLEG